MQCSLTVNNLYDFFRVQTTSNLWFVLSMTSFLVSSQIFYYVYAIIGMELFSGLISDDDPSNCSTGPLQNSAFAAARYCSNNFNNIASSFVVLYELTVVNQWHGNYAAPTSFVPCVIVLLVESWWDFSCAVCVCVCCSDHSGFRPVDQQVGKDLLHHVPFDLRGDHPQVSLQTGYESSLSAWIGDRHKLWIREPRYSWPIQKRRR